MAGVDESGKADRMFVPGLADVRGNECTDRLAGLAIMGIGSAIDWVYILNAIKQKGLEGFKWGITHTTRPQH